MARTWLCSENRLARVVEPLAGDARHLDQAGAPARWRQVRQLAAQHLDERAPGAALGVQILEPGGGLAVGRIGLEDLLEAGHRVLVLAELVGPQRRDPPVQRHAGRRIGGHLRLAGQDLHQIGVAPLGLVARGQRAQRGGVIGLERQDVEVGVDHHHLEVQSVAVDGDDLELAVDLLVDVGGRDGVEIVLEQLQQRVPLLGGGVELAQRRDGLGQMGPQAQEALPDLDRLVGVLRPLLGGARHLDPHGQPALGVGLGLLGLGQDRQQLRLFVSGAVVLAVELDHPAVGRIELAHPAEERLRHVGLAEPLPDQRREIGQQGRVLLAALGARRRFQHLAQLGPGLGGGQRGPDGQQRARLDRVGLQRLAEVAEGIGRALEPLAQLAGRHRRRGALLAGRRPLGPLRVERQQLVVSAALAQDPLEVRTRAAVGGIQLQALASRLASASAPSGRYLK